HRVAMRKQWMSFPVRFLPRQSGQPLSDDKYKVHPICGACLCGCQAPGQMPCVSSAYRHVARWVCKPAITHGIVAEFLCFPLLNQSLILSFVPLIPKKNQTCISVQVCLSLYIRLWMIGHVCCPFV